MSNPRERSKRVIAERFFAGETIGELMRDYEECEAFVLEAVREHRLSDNEEAVIEAARRWYEWKMDPSKKHPPKVAFTMYEMDLCERIEELDELEEAGDK